MQLERADVPRGGEQLGEEAVQLLGVRWVAVPCVVEVPGGVDVVALMHSSVTPGDPAPQGFQPSNRR